jgi:hypothetical protein
MTIIIYFFDTHFIEVSRLSMIYLLLHYRCVFVRLKIVIRYCRGVASKRAASACDAFISRDTESRTRRAQLIKDRMRSVELMSEEEVLHQVRESDINWTHIAEDLNKRISKGLKVDSMGRVSPGEARYHWVMDVKGMQGRHQWTPEDDAELQRIVTDFTHGFESSTITILAFFFSL